jgi:hypothetical protein
MKDEGKSNADITEQFATLGKEVGKFYVANRYKNVKANLGAFSDADVSTYSQYLCHLLES